MKGGDITSLNANNWKASNFAKLTSNHLVRPPSILLEETTVTLDASGEFCGGCGEVESEEQVDGGGLAFSADWCNWSAALTEFSGVELWFSHALDTQMSGSVQCTCCSIHVAGRCCRPQYCCGKCKLKKRPRLQSSVDWPWRLSILGSSIQGNMKTFPYSSPQASGLNPTSLLFCLSLMFLSFNWWHPHVTCHLISISFLITGAHLAISCIFRNTAAFCCSFIWCLPSCMLLVLFSSSSTYEMGNCCEWPVSSSSRGSWISSKCRQLATLHLRGGINELVSHLTASSANCGYIAIHCQKKNGRYAQVLDDAAWPLFCAAKPALYMRGVQVKPGVLIFRV